MRLTTRCLALSLSLLLPNATFADQRTCAAEWDWLTERAELTAATRFAPAYLGDGACRVRGVTLTGGDRVAYEAAAITWQIDGLDQAMAGTALPHAATLNIEDFRTTPQTGDGATDYIFSARQAGRGINANLSFNWDETSRDLTLHRLEIDPWGEDTLSLSAQLSGVDLSSVSALQVSIGSMALHKLELDVTSRGLFEDYILLPLGLHVITDSADPDGQVATQKAETARIIDLLPIAAVSGTSRAALKSLVADMPNPRGRLRLDLDTDAGVGLPRLIAFGAASDGDMAAALDALMDGVRLGATYDRSPIP